ncbi:MAG: 30S ribosomal protein S12 methylthiotransferase RimO [Chloroflexi bacterium]|nr:30S ribosomal protein S12 methylthiotransferase RimO [Chloroflexota bacterium]
MRFYLLSLGCPKNTVDSEEMTRLLIGAGHSTVSVASKADLVIVNTCGFIQAARDESIRALAKLGAKKASRQKLVAVGCFAHRSPGELKARVPQIDAILSMGEGEGILQLVGEEAVDRMERGLLHRSSPSAYLKIADGCDRACAFCVIPQIKGPYRSKPPADIIAEGRRLVEEGVSEIALVAQDTTAYGIDWGERDALANLIERLCTALPEAKWIRLMYANPSHVTRRLAEVMVAHPQVCHYLDIPLQHAHPEVLRRMNRPHDMTAVRRSIASLREIMSDIALRTTFIVGYPGETEEEFAALLDFILEVSFDHVGVFQYSREEGTRASRLPGQIPHAVKKYRYQTVMKTQQQISLKRNKQWIGRKLDVLVEGVSSPKKGIPEKEISVGRSFRHAPEVDGLVLCLGRASPGEMVQVRITGATEYDLLGRVVV